MPGGKLEEPELTRQVSICPALPKAMELPCLAATEDLVPIFWYFLIQKGKGGEDNFKLHHPVCPRTFVSSPSWVVMTHREVIMPFSSSSLQITSSPQASHVLMRSGTEE